MRLLYYGPRRRALFAALVRAAARDVIDELETAFAIADDAPDARFAEIRRARFFAEEAE